MTVFRQKIKWLIAKRYWPTEPNRKLQKQAFNSTPFHWTQFQLHSTPLHSTQLL